MTQLLKVANTKTIEQLKMQKEIQRAALALEQGKLVAFPTETVYGLGADATSKAAVQSIFVAKGRPQDNPLIVHIGHKEQLAKFTQDLPPNVYRLIDIFWPGPLTLILPHRGNIAPNVTAGLPTVGVRMPDHPVALALLQMARCPVAAPSANLSGRPSPTEANHVFEDLSGRIDIVLDGGHTGIGLESTILDVTQDIPVILRPGGITEEQIKEVIGDVQVDTTVKGKVVAPGMKYKHYAPKSDMLLIKGSHNNVVEYINKRTYQLQQEGKKVGVLTTQEDKEAYTADIILTCGERNMPHTIAQELYRTLRNFDKEKVDIILSETFPETGLFSSIMNRLVKAASGRIIEV